MGLCCSILAASLVAAVGSQGMPAYRLYRTDGVGHIRSSAVVEAKCDRDAMVAARETLKGGTGELWLEGKMVCRLGAAMDGAC